MGVIWDFTKTLGARESEKTKKGLADEAFPTNSTPAKTEKKGARNLFRDWIGLLWQFAICDLVRPAWRILGFILD